MLTAVTDLLQTDTNEIATEVRSVQFGAEGRSAYIRKMILVRLKDNKDYVCLQVIFKTGEQCH
jgi:hypothetical protein